MLELWALENEIYDGGVRSICGVDEAGRGPLAGPVCAAAVEPVGVGMPSATRGMRLMATRRCRRVSRQISTLPKPPVARVSSGR